MILILDLMKCSEEVMEPQSVNLTAMVKVNTIMSRMDVVGM